MCAPISVEQSTTSPIEIPSHTSSVAVICSPTFKEINKKLNESKYLKNYAFMQLPLLNKAVSQRPCLSPISGSFDCTDSTSDINDKIKKELGISQPSTSQNYVKDYTSETVSATNELPLTQLNLDLFTSEFDVMSSLHKDSPISSTNELPLSDIKFKQCDRNNHDLTPVLYSRDDSDWQSLPVRSFSDPNILDLDCDETDNKVFKLDNLTAPDEKQQIRPYFLPIDSPSFPFAQDSVTSTSLSSPQRSLSHPCHLSPVESPCFPFSFYPHDMNTSKKHASTNAPPSRSASQPSELSASVCNASPLSDASTPTDILSFSNDTPHKPVPPARSLSHPADLTPHSSPLRSPNHAHPPPVLTNPSAVNPELASARVTRHRHSISGQMSYIKMLGFGFGGPLGLKKLAGGSSNSLFSTAVISGSSSAPNLRDMIPNTASASGKITIQYIYSLSLKTQVYKYRR